MQHTLPDYIAAKIRQPRAFGPAEDAAIHFHFGASRRAYTALLAQTDRAQTCRLRSAYLGAAASTYQPAGKAGKLMEDMECFSCHAINGRGGDMAPDLTWEGSAVQRKWLVEFFEESEHAAPGADPAHAEVQPDRCEEINSLTDYIMTVYQTPAFDRDSMAESGYSATQVGAGRQLFYSKYACQACHIVDAKADKGYIGPTLTSVGSRLTAAWMYHWLKNPQALRAGTVEPNRNLSNDDAKALTAFLMMQKGSGQKEAKK